MTLWGSIPHGHLELALQHIALKKSWLSSRGPAASSRLGPTFLGGLPSVLLHALLSMMELMNKTREKEESVGHPLPSPRQNGTLWRR